MVELEKDNLFITFKGVIDSIILDKRSNPKNIALINKFKIKLNMGLQITHDYFFWINLVAENGDYTLNKGKLETYDLEIIAAPEDLMYFSNGQNSTIHMMLKKNRFGYRKLRFDKSSDGKRWSGWNTRV